MHYKNVTKEIKNDMINARNVSYEKQEINRQTETT